MELLITLTILPLVIGALSFGIIAVLSLNTQTTSRLSDTADAQVVASTYQQDVQSAGYITTASDSSPQCGAGAGTQLLALESVPNLTTGSFQTVISYDAVASGSSYNLERLYCTNGQTTPATTSLLAFDLPTPTSKTDPLTPPSISCSTGASPNICSASGQQWTRGYVPAEDIGTVSFNVTEPSSSYNYVLAASPAASTSFNSGGVASTTAAQCESTTGLNGPQAGQLCFIDFSTLSQNDIAAASGGGCYNMSVAIGASDILQFCIGFASNPQGASSVVPSVIPADTYAGLGHTVYAGIGGDPALYMSKIIGSDTFTYTLSGFSLVNAATGLPVTSWTFMSADAETTNQGESITWSSNNPLTVIDDAEPGATSQLNGLGKLNPVDGDACPISGGVGTSTPDSVNCTGTVTDAQEQQSGVALTGAAMISVLGTNLNSLVVTTNNYEAIAFGMFLP